MGKEKIEVKRSTLLCTTPGMRKTERGFYICTIAAGEHCSLILYEAGRRRGRKIPFPENGHVGDYWFMEFSIEDEADGASSGNQASCYEYTLEIDGTEILDPFGRNYTGRERWGDVKQRKRPIRSRVPGDDYDWEGDRPPAIPFQDTIIYRLHPRGFTKHASSKTEERGTFHAVREKIPYLKELGITAVELMPAYEFDEIMTELRADESGSLSQVPSGRLNYWGYGPGNYFAPKASYTSGGGREPEKEFKDLVKALHQAGIELIMELYFDGSEPPVLVQEAVRFWVSEYHADGIHLTGQVPGELLAGDPMLSSVKLFAERWEKKTGRSLTGKTLNRHLAEYNQGFLLDMRRALRGDEGLVKTMEERICRNPSEYGVVNYMAHTNGFTMMDMVTYEKKYNEANGEENRDGTDYNVSWNCGMEGPDKNKKLMQLRKKQLRNAYLMLFLSQGIPLLQAGDEFGNTQEGNNNAYCQDNEISWLNWNQRKTNRELYEFVKYLAAFRKKHPVFHKKAGVKRSDYLGYGIPDVSCHGVKAWYPEYEPFRRQLGLMYNGQYEKKEDGSPDDIFYAAYNMYGNSQRFGLPKLPSGMGWFVAIDSDAEERNGIYEEGEELPVADPMNCPVGPRSIVVFIGKKLPVEETEEAALEETVLEEAVLEEVVLGEVPETEKEEE